MRTVVAVTAIGLTSIGYFLGPAGALPIDCLTELETCQTELSESGLRKNMVRTMCGQRMQNCLAENKRNGYSGADILGPSEPDKKKESEKKKPKGAASPPHVAKPTKNGSIGSNAQLGTKIGAPTTAASTAISVTPTPEIKTVPPKPATVSNEAIAKRVGAGRF